MEPSLDIQPYAVDITSTLHDHVAAVVYVSSAIHPDSAALHFLQSLNNHFCVNMFLSLVFQWISPVSISDTGCRRSLASLKKHRI